VRLPIRLEHQVVGRLLGLVKEAPRWRLLGLVKEAPRWRLLGLVKEAPRWRGWLVLSELCVHRIGRGGCLGCACSRCRVGVPSVCCGQWCEGASPTKPLRLPLRAMKNEATCPPARGDGGGSGVVASAQLFELARPLAPLAPSIPSSSASLASLA
jgi:hypothetical protein